MKLLIFPAQARGNNSTKEERDAEQADGFRLYSIDTEADRSQSAEQRRLAKVAALAPPPLPKKPQSTDRCERPFAVLPLAAGRTVAATRSSCGWPKLLRSPRSRCPGRRAMLRGVRCSSCVASLQQHSWFSIHLWSSKCSVALMS